MSPVFFFRSAPTRFGPGLVAMALGCWGLAVFLLYYPLVAAVIVAAVLGLAGLAFLGIGAAVWRAEALRRGSGQPEAPPPPAGPVRNADATWRDSAPGPRLP